MPSRVPGACISRFVSRNARFVPSYAHIWSAFTYVNMHAYIYAYVDRYTHMYRVVSLLLARCTFFSLHSEFDKFICLCGAIGPHLVVVAVGKSTKRKRATKGPPMTVSFQRKRNCGGPAAESSTRCIYRSKIGIKRERATRGARFRPIIQRNKNRRDEKYWFLFWQVVPGRPFVARATAWATESRYCTSPMILNI